MQPFFTNNESDIPQLEGLYVKERTPPATIAGANLSKTCIVGETVRGPVGVAIDVSNEGRFQDVFGGSNRNNDSGPITNKVWQALLNKPFGQLSIVRVAAAAATTATANLSNAVPTAIVRVDASSPGAWGGDIQVKVAVPSSDGVSGRFDLTAKYLGKEYVYKNLDVSASGIDNTLQVLGTDYANPIVLTKLASGTPVVSAYASLSASVDGSVADSDYTTAGKGINVGAVAKSCGQVFMAEKSSSAVKAQVMTLSATVNDRLFIIEPDTAVISAATAITEAASYRTDRIVYAFNHPYTLDPRTATEIQTSPAAWVAATMSQCDVDINIGENAAKQFTQGITRLTHEEFVRGDYIGFKNAGISAYEKDNGFALVSAVTTSLTSGKDQITRRRMADFLQLSVADALKDSVKKKNTVTRRQANKSMVSAFLQGLQDAERVVNSYEVDTEKLNTVLARSQGIERLLMRVKIIDHMLELVLETEIGNTVVITAR